MCTPHYLEWRIISVRPDPENGPVELSEAEELWLISLLNDNWLTIFSARSYAFRMKEIYIKNVTVQPYKLYSE